MTSNHFGTTSVRKPVYKKPQRTTDRMGKVLARLCFMYEVCFKTGRLNNREATDGRKVILILTFYETRTKKDQVHYPATGE